MARSKSKNRKKVKIKSAPRALGVDQLRELLARRPREAAEHLLHLHRAAAGSLDAEIRELTVLAAGRVRRERAFDLAASLLAHAPADEPRAQIERGLLAFASGNDEALRGLASREKLPPAVARVIAPLVAALDGRPLARAPSGASGELKELYAATRFIAAVADSGPGPVAKAVTRASALHRQLRAAMEACVELFHGEPRAFELEVLRQIRDPEVTRLAQIAFARRSPHAALRVTQLSPEARQHAFVALESAGKEFVLALDDHDAFNLLERPGDGLLHLAFAAHAGGAARDAGYMLDAALAEGADLRECARLRWMLQDDAVRASDEDLRAFAKATATFERELARDPRLLAARVSVRLRLAAARAERAERTRRESAGATPSATSERELAQVASDLETIEGWIRGTWVDTLPLQCSIARARVRWHLARGEDDRAWELVESVLRDDPTGIQSWELAISMAAPEERVELARRAREATGAKRFEVGMALSGISPGALAREVGEAPADRLVEVITDVLSRASVLAPEARGWLGIGIARILAAREVELDVVAAFLDVWLELPEVEPTWIAEAFLYDEWDAAVRVFRARLRSAQSSGTALVSKDALVDLVVVAAAYDSDVAQVLYGDAALPLSRTELTRLRQRMRTAPTDPAFIRSERRAQEAHDALHPELCVNELDVFVDVDPLHETRGGAARAGSGPRDPGGPGGLGAEVDVPWPPVEMLEPDELSATPSMSDVMQALEAARASPRAFRSLLDTMPDDFVDTLVRELFPGVDLSPAFSDLPGAAMRDFLCSVITLDPDDAAPDEIARAVSALFGSADGGARSSTRIKRKKPKPKRRKKK